MCTFNGGSDASNVHRHIQMQRCAQECAIQMQIYALISTWIYTQPHNKQTQITSHSLCTFLLRKVAFSRLLNDKN